MWPEANSEAERTSTSRVGVDGRVRSSATVMVGLKIPPTGEEREFWEKDSRGAQACSEARDPSTMHDRPSDDHASLRMTMVSRGARVRARCWFRRRLFLGVFFHPGFPAFAGSGVASGKGEGGDVGVGDGDFFVGSFWEEADDGIFQRGGGAAVEEVAFDFAAVLASDS